jgi:hypothetical protein
MKKVEEDVGGDVYTRPLTIYHRISDLVNIIIKIIHFVKFPGS